MPSGQPHGHPSPHEHRVEVHPCPRRIRVAFAGRQIADTTRALLLRETRCVPVYYLPIEDMRMEYFTATAHTTHCPYKGDACYWTIAVSGYRAENAGWSYPEPLDGAPDLRGHIALYWHLMDAWFEEDDEVFVHPRDPFTRVDALPSSRHVQVVVGGETVADSRRPVLLFETGLPTRYYLPRLDVRTALLTPSDTVTRCPYKGEAGYYSLTVGSHTEADLVWYYRYPTPEVARIAGHLCFFDERVDAVYVDGKEQPKPATKWSRR